MSGRGSKVSSLRPARSGNQKYMCSSLSLNCSPFPPPLPSLSGLPAAASGAPADCASSPLSASPAVNSKQCVPLCLEQPAQAACMTPGPMTLIVLVIMGCK